MQGCRVLAYCEFEAVKVIQGLQVMQVVGVVEDTGGDAE